MSTLDWKQWLASVTEAEREAAMEREAIMVVDGEVGEDEARREVMGGHG